MQPRFIDTGFNDAFTNMAIDEALAQSCKEPILRVYQWKPSAVSIGYNQNMQKEINLGYCKKNNIDVVRRITGGKAVFHDKEITYSFIVPENLNLLPKDVVESYKIIAKALVLAFKKLKINVDIKKINEKITTPICFNSSNWYELTVNNKKISGSAQRRFDGKILQHGPILIDFDYKKNLLLFNSNNEIDTIDNLKERITSIKNELSDNNAKNKNYNIEKINDEHLINELKNAIKLGFKENFNFEFINDSLNEKEIQLMEKLRKEKYSAQEWNYRLLTKTI
ncbi:hypothetical protein CMO93_02595 [Candidatus Woesearchaeota archaeon]|nr:hypothetical protein [Candidatus Woesearchaeota archaeon]|tara:strand:- start:640 stop:1482 length:843 start_codon:yes stop_codon:yes gene_type:complete